MNNTTNTYEVVISCSGGEECYTIRAKTAKDAEFDAKHDAQKTYPFCDSFIVVSVIRVKR